MLLVKDARGLSKSTNELVIVDHLKNLLSCERFLQLFAVSLFLFLWVLLAGDYKEPEAAFKKVTWDKVGFEDYFLNKSTSAQIGSSECWEVRVTSVKSRDVLNHLQSFDSSCSYFVFLNQLQSLSYLLKYTREVDSRILYAVQDNWML